jgi:hypothetical protein
MSGDDVTYFQRRAEDEIEAAQRASHSKAVQAHYSLASAYLDRIHGDSPQSAPNFLTA